MPITTWGRRITPASMHSPAAHRLTVRQEGSVVDSGSNDDIMPAAFFLRLLCPVIPRQQISQAEHEGWDASCNSFSCRPGIRSHMTNVRYVAL
jgi:hypothetical protein